MDKQKRILIKKLNKSLKKFTIQSIGDYLRIIKIKGGKMKKIITYIFVFILSLGFISATETAEINITANYFMKTVSITVPDEIDFGNISQGYISEKKSFYINNTGTTDVLITASIDENSEFKKIFENLDIKKTSTGTWLKLNEFNLTIKKPSILGGIEDQIVYMQLDLTNATDINIPSGKVQTKLIFTALAQ